MSAIALFEIQQDVTVSEFRAQLRKKGFRRAAISEVSKLRLLWTASAENAIFLPEVGSDSAKIAAGTCVAVELEQAA
jgi:hypothetical protein